MNQLRRPLAVVISTGYEEYQQRLVRGAASVLSAHGAVLVLSSYDPLRPQLPPEVAQVLRGARPYGVLASPCFSPTAEGELADILQGVGIPAVWIGAQRPGYASVTSDDVAGLRALTEYLVQERGIRRPVLIRGVPHQQDSIRRETIVRQVLADCGIALDEDLVVDGEFWHEPAYRRTLDLLSRRRDLDAVLAANDLSAIGALWALAEVGLRVPEDVLVAGFDNDQAAALTWPGLTSVDPGLEEQGRLAGELLLSRIRQGGGPVERTVSSRLVLRGSTGFLEGGRAEAAVAIARRSTAEVGQRDSLRVLSGSVHGCANVADLASTLAGGHLQRLRVSRCFLGLYDRPDDAGGATRQLWARLCLDYRDGAQQSLTDQLYPMDQLLPDQLQDQLESGQLVLLPLSAPQRRLGYVLFQQDGGSGMLADALRVELSRLLERVFTTQELKDHADALERTVDERTEELHRVNADLERLVTMDQLTGLGNRVALDRHLAAQLSRRPGLELALIMIDVDLFKQYNDHFGHLADDDTLRLVAARLRLAMTGPEDLACRFGGEEFVVVLPNGGLTAAMRTLDSFRLMLAQAAVPHPVSPVAPVVTVSAGVAIARVGAGLRARRLLEAADAAMYRAKADGRNRVYVSELDAGEVLPLGPSLSV